MKKTQDLIFLDTTTLTSDNFIRVAKEELVKFYSKRDNPKLFKTHDLMITKDGEGILKRDFFVKNSNVRVIANGQRDFNIQIVWFSKTLQNFKCILCVINNQDRLLAEFIYNGDKKEFYLDVYDKIENVKIEVKQYE